MARMLSAQSRPDVDEALAVLRAGGLVALPTETVYGLGADGLSETAVARIFVAKGRPSDNPLILHACGIEEALSLWRATDAQRNRARRLAEVFWPGPLTLVLPADARVPNAVRAGLDTVAVRVPDQPVTLEIIRRLQRPVAAPSANASGRPSPTQAAHVERTLTGRIDAILDAGPCGVGLESTVLDIRGEDPRILRPGAVDAAAVETVLGRPPDTPRGADDAGRSPGTRHRHYAPEGVDSSLVELDEVADLWRDACALLLRESAAATLEARLGTRSAPLMRLADDPEGFARDFYDALHRLERTAATSLRVQVIPEGPEWDAVRDRVHRAIGEI